MQINRMIPTLREMVLRFCEFDMVAALLTPVYARGKGRVQKIKARHDAALLEKRGGVRKHMKTP